MPVLPMFERIRHQLMDWFTKRRTVEANTVSLLVTSVAERIQVLFRQRTIRYRHIKRSDDVTFEVKSSITTSEYVINIGERTCSCRIWQSTGIPCGHALAVLCRYGYDPNTYTKQFFTLDYFHKTYKNAIFHPLTGDYTQSLQYPLGDDEDDIEDLSDIDEDPLLPPSTRRPAGRPKKRRIRGPMEDIDGAPRHQNRCGRCRDYGHTRKTGREAI